MSTPSGSRDYGKFDELAEEFVERIRRGEQPSIEELAARHPELAEPIRKLLPAPVGVERDLSLDDGPAAPRDAGLARRRTANRRLSHPP